MSEPAIRRQPIDLDEFERRLRGAPREASPGAPVSAHAASPAERPASDDPLAELARLVGGKKDPFAQAFNRQAPAPAIEPPSRAAYQQIPQPAAAPVPNGYGDGHWQDDGQGYGQGAGAYGETDPVYDEDVPGAADFGPQGRVQASRRPMMIVGGLAAVLLLGTGAFMLRGGPAGQKQPPTILALSGPAKVQPPESSQTDAAPTASMLDKDNPDKAGPAKVVNRQEDPVDLNQAARTAKAAAPAGAPAGSMPPSASPFGEPKRVHTIAVRPDGTLILPDGSGAQRQAAAPPAPTPAPMASAPSPSLGTTATASPASTMPAVRPPVRVVNAAAGSTPAAPRTQVASAGESDATPVQLAPKTPVRTASVTPATTPAAAKPAAEADASGAFAVQLAAAGSEAEAREKMTGFAKKYSGQLGGHRLGYKQGESNGKSVWRVRVGGLSQDVANSLCESIKGGGGACFVAKN